tara:strand:+ start:194 stop:721 length:528 start_codon:yes stop_codon:yes gene_type:complete
MADLRVDIKEFITLHGDKYDSLNTLTIKEIDEISKRVVTIPSSSEREIMSVTSSIGSGQFITGDVQYARFTNLGSSTTTGSVPVVLTFKNTNDDEFAIKVDEGYSYVYSAVGSVSDAAPTNTASAALTRPGGVSSTFIATGSNADINTTFGDLRNVTAISSGSFNCNLELFIASK